MIKKILSNLRFRSQEFIPKSILCFREGYTVKTFFHDLFAGVSVGIIAIPLSLAFAIASGLSPEKGLFTAIIGGFLISLLGGSRIQIGGPAGAFVILIFGIVQKFGYEGLALATLIAAFIMILMGIFRLGILLKFVPFPVTTGFTTGIALVIFQSQIKDFFGLQVEALPPGFMSKWSVYMEHFGSTNFHAFGLGLSTLCLLFLFKRYFPRLPGAMITMAVATTGALVFHWPVETIGSKFGEIPNALPSPHLPLFSFELMKSVFPSALTIAFLGAIESLLSAAVADGMTGNRHRSNCELLAQGFANLGSVAFGGIPATGVIARTSANIKLGAKTPVAGMIHALTVFIFMFFFAPLVAKIPLATLAGVLMYVAWNMSEIPQFVEILKGQKGDAIVLLITFVLTILMDLSVAVQVGVVLSAMIFLKRMTHKTTINLCKILEEENRDETEKNLEKAVVLQKKLPEDISVFEIKGPFFYCVANLLEEALVQLKPKPRVFILCVDKTPLIDATGIQAIKRFYKKCKEKEIVFLIAGVNEEKMRLFKKTKLEENVGAEKFFHHIESALIYSRTLPVRDKDEKKFEKPLLLSNETI